MMKNYTKLVIVLTCLFGFLGFMKTEAQVDRMVIVEHFSNASCVPCAQQNPAFNNLLQPNLDRVIPVKFQTSWPGFDPYNAQNPFEVQNRVTHYNVSGVPAVFLDGVSQGVPGNVNQAGLNQAINRETYIDISIDVDWNEDFNSATVNVNINNLDSNELSGNNRLILLLIEAKNDWPFPPGSTNEQNFSNVMRKMYPGPDGTFVGNIQGNAELSFEFETEIPDYIFDLSQMRFVAYLENPTSRRIHNGVLSDLVELTDLYADLAILGSNSEATPELCGRTLDAGMEIQNSGNIDVTEFTAAIIIGGEASIYNFEGLLEPGDTYLVEFPELELMAGSNNVDYSIESVNDGTVRQVNLLNTFIPSESYPAIGAPVSTDLNLDFESDPVNTVAPEGLIINNPGNFTLVIDQTSFSSPPGPLGGYGMSAKSLWVNFWQWNPASVGGVNNGDIINSYQIDIEGAEDNLILSFDRAYARYTEGAFTSNDGLRIHLSTDCGDSWSQIYSKFGTALQTVPPSSNFFMPTANQWASDTIQLSGIEGEELLVRFEVVSDWGNNLFLDNIKVEALSVSTAEIDPLGGSLHIFPNPATDLVYFEFELESPRTMQIEIYDMKGRLVSVIDSNKNYDAGHHSVNWQPAVSGQYFIKFFDGKSQKAERFSVIR